MGTCQEDTAISSHWPNLSIKRKFTILFNSVTMCWKINIIKRGRGFRALGNFVNHYLFEIWLDYLIVAYRSEIYRVVFSLSYFLPSLWRKKKRGQFHCYHLDLTLPDQFTEKSVSNFQGWVLKCSEYYLIIVLDL